MTLRYLVFADEIKSLNTNPMANFQGKGMVAVNVALQLSFLPAALALSFWHLL